MTSIFKGSLEHIVLPDLLTFVNMINKTGELVFTSGKTRKVLYLEEGEIVFASSSDPDDSLGAFLVKSGIITHKQNMESASKVTADKRQGKVLVEMGLIKPRELWWGVKNQILDIVYSLFAWETGTFEMFETGEAIEEKISLNINTTNIIMEGIRRLDEWAKFKSKIPSYGVVPETAEEGRKKAKELSADERAVMDLIDGKRSIRKIIKGSDLGEFMVTRIIYSLLVGEMITVKERAITDFEDMDDSEVLAGTVNLYNEIFQHIYKAVEAKTGDEAEEIFNVFFRDEQTQDNDLFTDVYFRENGKLDTDVLMANIADLPASERNRMLDAGLNDLLSFQLFEMTRYLDKDEKEELYRYVADKKENLELPEE